MKRLTGVKRNQPTLMKDLLVRAQFIILKDYIKYINKYFNLIKLLTIL